MLGTVFARDISIARILNGTVPSKEELKPLRDLLKKLGAQASKERKKTIPWDKLSFNDTFEKLLFFHRARVGVEYARRNIVCAWDRRPFDLVDQLELQQQFREFGRKAKWLSVDWSFNEASTLSEVQLFDNVTGDNPISVGFSTGFNVDDKPVDVGLQQSIFESVLEGVGIRGEFEYCEVEDQRCLLPKRTHKRAKLDTFFNVDAFLFQNKTREFIVNIGKGMTARTSLTPFRISVSCNFAIRNNAIEFGNLLIELVKRAAGDPTSGTIEYWFNAVSLDDEFAATRMKVVPCHSLLLDYRKGFDPLVS